MKCAQRKGKLEEIFKEKIQKCRMRFENLKKNTPIVTEKTQKLRWMKMKNEAHSGSKWKDLFGRRMEGSNEIKMVP